MSTSGTEPMRDVGTITAALDRVAPRLRRVRKQRGITLTELSERTGMRLVLGDRDLVLRVGEATEFDTQLPHWSGSTGDGPAEVLSIFGRPGERMNVLDSEPDAGELR